MAQPIDLKDFSLNNQEIKLIIRSHEGPDSRDSEIAPDRSEHFPSLRDGFSVDQKCDDTSLVTVFSAPDYPQHEKSDNNASIIFLKGPCYYKDYEVVTFKASPRPFAEAYYDIEDEDLEITQACDEICCRGGEDGEEQVESKIVL